MSRIEFHPQVWEDLATAVRWHAGRGQSVMPALEEEMRSALEQVQRNPEAFPRRIFGLRRVLLRRRPYALYYLVTADLVFVTCLWPVKSDPKKLVALLQSRI